MGWKPVGFSEIEKFPSQVLAHHYPQVTNFGDMTKYKEWNINEPIGLLVGGTPCQSFSVAGLRKGLDDPRGNLALTYVGILDKFRPKWCVWENVPGVLSSGNGRDFGAFLGALGELGYGWAYRVLDAQNFGVAQRRRRVFVVGCLGGWESAAKVLFESESLSGDIKQSRKTRQEAANSFIPSVVGTLDTECGGGRKAHQSVMSGHFIPTFWNGGQTAETITCTSDDQRMPDKNRFQAVIQAYENHGTDSRIKEIAISPTVTARWGTGGNNVPLAMQGNLIGRDKGGPNGIGVSDSNTMYTLTKTDVHAVVTGFNSNARPDEMKFLKEQSNTLTTSQNSAVFCDTYNGTIQGNVAATMTADMAGPTHSGPKVMQNMAVRRLTEVECERLQGFPDDYTNIKENCPSGARYKALGNSMAVPVMRWIGERINNYERI
jgi:DNA (cytosine-5)-methyltransferase 1